MGENNNGGGNGDGGSAGRGDAQARAYRAGARISRDRMKKDDPRAAEALARSGDGDILVVGGVYDHVELVLDALELEYTMVTPESLLRRKLDPGSLLVVNCPGNLPVRALPRVRRFVERGGSLFTTDWALRNVIEPAFPGVLAYNERPTADDVVRVEICDHDNPFLDGVLDAGDEPVWWLEGSSYPIRVLDRDKVQVLLRSKELGKKYGEQPVAVTFAWGKGEVFHMISHYFLQRTELRTSRQKTTALCYANEKGYAASPLELADMDGLAYGEVEAAAASSRFLGNIVAQKRLRREE